MVRSLYVDEETKQLESEILNKEPEFNFSNFYKSALIQLKCDNKNQSFEVLNAKLEEARFKLNQYSEEVRYYEKLIQKAVKDREEKVQCDFINKKKEQETKDIRITDQAKNIRDFYEITDEALILSLATEFVHEYFQSLSIFEFMETKGYKEKPRVEVKKEKIPMKQVIEKDVTIDKAVKNKEYEELMKIALGEKEYE